MRPKVWVTLLVFVVLAAGMRAHSASARGSSKVSAPAITSGEKVVSSWVVVGKWKETQEEAIDSALEEARSELAAHLKKENPQLGWTPPVDHVRKHLLTDLRPEDQPKDETKVLRPIERSGRLMLEEEKDFQGQVGTMRRVWLKVALTPDQSSVIQGKEKEYRQQQRLILSQQRQILLAKVLASVVALLGTVVGYLRLEEATKGYYTGWLRAAAVAILAVVVAGLLLAA